MSKFKLPKPYRRAAEAALAELSTPAGLALVAGALSAAAAALAEGAVEEAEDEPRRAAERPRPPMDVNALLGLAATAAIKGLRAANERGQAGEGGGRTPA